MNCFKNTLAFLTAMIFFNGISSICIVENDNLITTTWFPSRLTGGFCPALENGKLYEFGLNPVSDNTASSIYPKIGGELKAQWLGINTPLTIPRWKVSILTPELNGGSIYIKANSDRETVTIFHHLRHFGWDGKGHNRLAVNSKGKYVVDESDLEFDDVLAWEEYFDGFNTHPFSYDENRDFCGIVRGKLPNWYAEKLEVIHTLAKLESDDTGNIFYRFQNFKNSPDLDNQGELKGFQYLNSDRRKALLSWY